MHVTSIQITRYIINTVQVKAKALKKKMVANFSSRKVKTLLIIFNAVQNA